MFTGIIEKTGRIAARTADKKPDATSIVLTVETGYRDLTMGESVAINGVCLTVAEGSDLATGRVNFFVSPETLDRTSLGAMNEGSLVNLERALRLGDRLSGHLVQGHVDGLAICTRIEVRSEARLVEFKLPPALARYAVEKGSIALDGVSLTLNSVSGELVSVMLIPHTWDLTRFHQMKTGDALNVEVDVFAKYTEKLCQPYSPHSKP